MKTASIVLAIANQKGGVGKTNLTGNLAAEIAALGHTVTLIDLDPQATLSTWLLGRTKASGVAEVLLGEARLDDAVVEVSAFGCKLLRSVPERMRIAERTLAAQFGAERILAKALKGHKAEVILIDCPPSMGILTASALVASTGVLVPVSAAPESLDGYAQFTGNLERLREALDLKLPLVAAVPTRYDARLKIAREVLDVLHRHAEEAVTSPIRESVALRELFGHRSPIRNYKPDSSGALDYAALASEVLNRVNA